MKEFWARQKMAWALVLSMSVLPLNGCVYFVVGSIGALGGYVASPDTVEGTLLNRSFDQVWLKASEVLAVRGIIEEKNDEGGMLGARVDGSTVSVSVFRLGTDSVKISVKARKGVFPQIRTAQDLYVKIVGALDS